jgi:SNF2 family DNA or RNA helicase
MPRGDCVKSAEGLQGPLFKVEWYRIVLDEAHIIRNRGTRAAKAVWDLDSVYKWCLTGTLIVNGLDDVFSQLKFLGNCPVSVWAEFRDRISSIQKRKPRLATTRMQVSIDGLPVPKLTVGIGHSQAMYDQTP